MNTQTVSAGPCPCCGGCEKRPCRPVPCGAASPGFLVADVWPGVFGMADLYTAPGGAGTRCRYGPDQDWPAKVARALLGLNAAFGGPPGGPHGDDAPREYKGQYLTLTDTTGVGGWLGEASGPPGAAPDADFGASAGQFGGSNITGMTGEIRVSVGCRLYRQLPMPEADAWSHLGFDAKFLRRWEQDGRPFEDDPPGGPNDFNPFGLLVEDLPNGRTRVTQSITYLSRHYEAGSMQAGEGPGCGLPPCGAEGSTDPDPDMPECGHCGPGCPVSPFQICTSQSPYLFAWAWASSAPTDDPSGLHPESLSPENLLFHPLAPGELQPRFARVPGPVGGGEVAGPRFMVLTSAGSSAQRAGGGGIALRVSGGRVADPGHEVPAEWHHTGGVIYPPHPCIGEAAYFDQPGEAPAPVMAASAPAAPARSARVALPARSPCPHLGAVLQPCTTCGSELRHVHACDHPDAEWSRCWRGSQASADPDIQSCERCPLHPDAAAGEAAQAPGG